jgi:hypothetical protein
MVAPLFPVQGSGFPDLTVIATLVTNTAKDGSFNLPSDVKEGELLIIGWSGNDTNGNQVTVTTPSGWTAIATAGGSVDGGIGTWYKIATASDAGASVDCASTSHEEGGYFLVRVQNKSGDFTSVVVNTSGADYSGTGSSLSETDIPTPTNDATTAFLAFAFAAGDGGGNRSMSVTNGGAPIFDYGASQTFDIRAYLEVRLWIGPVKGNLAITPLNTSGRGMIASAGISIK